MRAVILGFNDRRDTAKAYKVLTQKCAVRCSFVRAGVVRIKDELVARCVLTNLPVQCSQSDVQLAAQLRGFGQIYKCELLARGDGRAVVEWHDCRDASLAVLHLNGMLLYG